jgi:hypothetical protein
MIHCIGNSHANMFTGSPPGQMFQPTYGQHFSSTSIGPVIAYNFTEHHEAKCLEELSKIPVKPGDRVMLIVGEVDCRLHLPRRIATNNESIESVVFECTNRFFRSVLNLKNRGYNMVTWCGHPSTTDGHRDNYDSPVWGDCLTRNKISIQWKKSLEALSLANSIPCVSIIDDMIKEDGLTDMSYFIDYCHLNSQKALPLVINKFIEKGLI